jgi:TolB-like protein
VTRLIVLPLTLLRPDPEFDFLPVALSDAITASLCGLESLVVRSTRTAARYASADPDLRKLAAEAEVDAAVVGTLLRGGSRIRLNAQLVEVPAGTVLWSKTFDAALSDIFEVQDELTGRVVEALAIPLSSREERQLHRDVPASARAYELYLRANHVGIAVTSSSQLSTARDLYRSCLQDDPRFAPAWARLGRVYRIMAKYGHGEWRENVRLAEEAFAKAFELNPDSPLAHSYYTYFELEERGDAPGAVVRLLGRVRARAADPEIFAGLVTATRFCGLYEASLAAHERARRLDPRIRTSVPFTHWMRGDLESAIASDHDHPPLIRIWSLALMDEPRARGELQALAASPVDGIEHHAIRYTLASFDGEAAAVEREVSALLSGGFHDPEGIYMATRALARLGPAERAIAALRLIVDKNFCVHESLPRDPWFASIRDLPETRQILAESRGRHLAAAERFREADGASLLGIGG